MVVALITITAILTMLFTVVVQYKPEFADYSLMIALTTSLSKIIIYDDYEKVHYFFFLSNLIYFIAFSTLSREFLIIQPICHSSGVAMCIKLHRVNSSQVDAVLLIS